MKSLKNILIFLILINTLSCDNNDVSGNSNLDLLEGTGAYNFTYSRTNEVIDMNIFYHVPSGDIQNMPILFVFHGNNRNANEYRDSWINEANEKQFIVVTPEFSSNNFPGGDGYNLGNVFVDGDNPSPATLNAEQDWAFSVIEPLFDDIKSRTGNTSGAYNVFGFSAGGQFAHRFVMFKPNARVDKIVASASGWYTVPDPNIEFPYGIGNCPIENTPVSSYFSKNMTIQIGTLDNDPNAPALRRNSIVDQQGTNRYDRAFYMFNTSKDYAENLGVNFNWDIIETEGNGHNYQGAVDQAGDILFAF